MSKLELKNKVTGEILYPVTIIDNVLVEEDKSLKEILDISPIPGDLQIVYTTTDNERYAIEKWDYYDEHVKDKLVSNIYSKERGFGVITLNSDEIPASMFELHVNVGNHVTSVKIGSGFTTIGRACFYENKYLKHAELSEGIESIMDNAFTGSGIESIYFPDSLTYLDSYSFQFCPNLKHIRFPEGETECTIMWMVFYGCVKLESVYFPDNMKLIPHQIFRNCYNLSRIRLPNKVEEIGAMAFAGCPLSYVNIPSTVTAIYDQAFNRNSSGPTIEEINIPNSITDLGLALLGIGRVDRIIFPASLKSIGGWANGFPRVLDSSASFISNVFPAPNYLEQLILRHDGVIKDLDTYVTTFVEDNPEKVAMISSALEQDIMPTTNLDTWLGTPNNWLRIYVPANRLAEYKEAYPTLKSYFHPISGEEPMDENIATKDDIASVTELINADKENLKNFKLNVEANYVKDEDWNRDKGTLMSLIIELQKEVLQLKSLLNI